MALVRMLVMRSPLVFSSGASEEKERTGRDPAIDILVLLERRLIILVVVAFMFMLIARSKFTVFNTSTVC